MHKLLVPLVILLLAPLALAAEPEAGPAEPEGVTVDLGRSLGPATHRGSGFLHALSASQPKESLLAPLKPRLVRQAFDGFDIPDAGAVRSYERLHRLGCRQQVVMSDSHGYGLAKWWPTDSDERFSQWQATMRDMLTRARARRATFQWDIWNEPNIGYFWPKEKGRDDWLELWRKSYQFIRSIDPKATIVGPSLSGLAWDDWMQPFLDYAKQHDVLPDVISWHEFDHRKIEPNVARVRKYLADNGIADRPITLNEIISANEQTEPGAAVQYFAALERAKVDGACHACWGDEAPSSSNCYARTLDGILTPDERKPRSTWWAYRRYADVIGDLLSVESGATVDGIAAVDDRGVIRILLGRGRTKEAGAVRLRLTGAREDYQAKVERIADSGWKPAGVPQVADAPVQQSAGVATIELPQFSATDALFITLHPAARSAQAVLASARTEGGESPFAIRGIKGLWWEGLEKYELALPWIADHGMNFLMLCYTSFPASGKDWRADYSPEELAGIKKLRAAADERGVELCLSFNPGIWSKPPLVYASEDDYQLAWKKVKRIHDETGIRSFALCLDDINKALQPPDAERFKTLQAAQVYFVNRLWKDMQALDSKTRLIFCPSAYTSREMLAHREYTETIGREIDPGVMMFWTGPEVCSPTIIAADADAVTAMLQRKPLVWDNYPVNDMFPWRPLVSPVKGRSKDLASHVAGLMANPMKQWHASRLPLATLADYLRDPASYDPGQSMNAAIDEYDPAERPALRTLVEVYGDSFWGEAGFPPKPRQLEGEAARAQLERYERVSRLLSSTRALEPVWEDIRPTVEADIAECRKFSASQ